MNLPFVVLHLPGRTAAAGGASRGLPGSASWKVAQLLGCIGAAILRDGIRPIARTYWSVGSSREAGISRPPLSPWPPSRRRGRRARFPHLPSGSSPASRAAKARRLFRPTAARSSTRRSSTDRRICFCNASTGKRRSFSEATVVTATATQRSRPTVSTSLTAPSFSEVMQCDTGSSTVNTQERGNAPPVLAPGGASGALACPAPPCRCAQSSC